MALVFLNLAKCRSSQLLHRLIQEQSELCHDLDIQTQNFPDFLLGWPLIIDHKSSTRYYGDDAFEYILRRNLTSNVMAESSVADNIIGANMVDGQLTANIEAEQQSNIESRRIEAGMHASTAKDTFIETNTAPSKNNSNEPNLQHVETGASSISNMDPVVGAQDQFSAILKTYKIPK